MKSVRFSRFGEPGDVLQVEERPTPEPGPGELLIRMTARPVNPSDLLTIRGQYGVRPPLPATPGLEGAGVVAGVGPGGDPERVGQRVIPLFPAGSWQEFIVATAEQLIPVPDSVEDRHAAQLVVNPLTAWVMVADVLGVQPGQWLLQTAAGSTLGRVVLQIARLRGVRTINVVRRRAQVDELKALGADEVICTADEDLAGRVEAITGGKGVPAAIEAVGGQLGADVASALGRDGVMLAYGLLSGEPAPIHYGRLIFQSATVRGFWLARWFRTTPPEQVQATIRDVLGLMARGELVPPVDAEFPLADVLQAVREAETPGRSGKVLLVG